MDMNRSFNVRKEDRSPEWIELNAEGQVLGRLATKIANILRGKHRPYYTPHTDCGDYVIVLNAEKVVLTGNKWTDKIYITKAHGYMGNKKETAARDLAKKHPEKIIELAVERMLPKNKLSRSIIGKLKVYVGQTHPHQAQVAPKSK
ncbi:MAG TPA: 50S ribosomal protein L13 [Candidatus Bathyarchaeia archaeon]|nr:50S ribosomal protein L13 [Candidatus Bathyarchaeia archaeon]